MIWDNRKVFIHGKTAKILSQIKNEVLLFLKENPQTNEIRVQEFILEKFSYYKLKNEKENPIVAFRENTSLVHYYPNQKSNKKLKPNSLILIDIWARFKEKGSPYADLTWMAYRGDEAGVYIKKVFDTVVSARNKGLRFMKNKLKNSEIPTGRELDYSVRKFIEKSGYGDNFPHSAGHELGFYSPHGKGGRISPKNRDKIKKMLPYTIEPGIYLEGQFGIRSEIDFYINQKNGVIVTTDLQNKLTLI